MPSPVWCNVNASDHARPTQMSCGPGPPRGGGLGPDRRGSPVYDLQCKQVTVLGPLRPCSHLFRFAFRSRSGPVPLVRVAFTPAKIDRTCSGCGPATRSHLFRNATGTRTVTPPQHTRFLILGLFSSRRVTALTASRHRRRRSRIDGQIRRCMMCPTFGRQRYFGRCIFL